MNRRVAHRRDRLLGDQFQHVDDGDVAQSLSDAQRRRSVLQEDTEQVKGQGSSDEHLEQLKIKEENVAGSGPVKDWEGFQDFNDQVLLDQVLTGVSSSCLIETLFWS